MTHYISPPPMNPLARLLAAVLAALALVAALFFGVVVLAVVVGVGVIGWLVLWLRVWWLQRKGRGPFKSGSTQGAATGRDRAGPRRPGEVIDGEYTVVSDQDKREKDSSDL